MKALITKVLGHKTGILVLENLINTGLALVVAFAALRHWGPGWIGITSQVLAIVGLTAFMGVAPLDMSFIKRIGEHEDPSQLLSNCMLLRTLTALVSVVATGLIAFQWTPQLDALSWGLLWIFQMQQVLSAFNLYPLAMMTQEAIRPLVRIRLTTTLIFFVIKIASLKLNIWIQFYYMLFVVELLIQFLLLKYASQQIKLVKPCWNATWELFKEIKPFIITNFFLSIFFKLDILLVSKFVNNHELGLYSAGLKIIELYNTGVGILFNQGYIKLSKLKNQSRELYLKYHQFLFQIAWGLGFAIALGHWLLFRHVLIFILGSDYNELAQLSAIMGLVLPISFVASIRAYGITLEGMTNNHIYSALIGTASVCITVPLLVGTYGITGAAWALVLNYLLSGLLSTYILPDLKQFRTRIWGSYD